MDLITTFDNKKLILKNLRPYNGIITLQYLPTGGIQMIRDNKMIINYNNSFIYTEEINFNNQDYNIVEFTKLYPNLVNQVLPL
jgi:hypothetical protein